LKQGLRLRLKRWNLRLKLPQESDAACHEEALSFLAFDASVPLGLPCSIPPLLLALSLGTLVVLPLLLNEVVDVFSPDLLLLLLLWLLVASSARSPG